MTVLGGGVHNSGPGRPSAVRVAPHLLVQHLPDGESVLLDLETEEYFGFDEVGTRMWYLLTTGHSLEEAHGALLEEYAADPRQLRDDLEEFFCLLLRHRFIEVDDP